MGTATTTGSIIRSRSNKRTQQGSDEEQEDLDDDTSDQQPNEARLEVMVRVLTLGGPDKDQRAIKRVAIAVSVEVVTQQAGGGEIEDEDDEVEEGGEVLQRAAEEEHREDREERDHHRENASDLGQDHFAHNMEVSVPVLVDHVRADSNQDHGEEKLQEADHPGGDFGGAGQHRDGCCFCRRGWCCRWWWWWVVVVVGVVDGR
jgi:hypothetical protein